MRRTERAHPRERAEPGNTGRRGDRHRRPRPDDGLGVAVLLRQLVLLGTAIIAAVSVVTLFGERWWVAELFTHFRIQYIASAIALLIAALFVHSRLGTVTLAACIALNMIPVLGYMPIASPARSSPVPAELPASPVAASRSPAAGGPGSSAGLRIISTNVRGERTEVVQLIRLLHETRPDLFVVLELTPAFAAGLDTLATDYPYRLSAPAPGAFGIGLYSSLPLVDAVVFPLGPTHAVRASIDTPTGAVDFIGVHLLPPTSADRATKRNDQLLRIAALVRDREHRAIVCGDFNLTPYSPYFAQLLDLTGLRDVRHRDGLAWTWPAGFMPLALPIDHCLAGEGVAVSDTEVLGDIGSDHYPLLIDIIAGRNG